MPWWLRSWLKWRSLKRDNGPEEHEAASASSGEPVGEQMSMSSHRDDVDVDDGHL